jgi:hypothetical protein
MVRLVARGQYLADPKVILTPVNGADSIEMAMRDDGEMPDVVADDGTWAGTSLLAHDAYAVTLDLGGHMVDGDTIRWGADELARDLALTFDGDGLQASTSSSPANLGTGGEFGAQGRPRGAAFGAGEGGSAKGSRGLLLLGLGGGVLSLGVGATFLLMRGREDDEPLFETTRVPEPPLLGPPSPPLSDGMCQWVVETDCMADATASLVATLARTHRVLVVAPKSVMIPLVHGGPVYRLSSVVPDDLEDAVEILVQQGDLPTAVLLVLVRPAPEVLIDYASRFPEGVGGIALLGQAVDCQVPIVRLTLNAHGSFVQVGKTQGPLRRSAHGLVPTEVA